MVLYIFSTHGWIRMLKNKTDETVAAAFWKLLSDIPTRPKRLWTDKGKKVL